MFFIQTTQKDNDKIVRRKVRPSTKSFYKEKLLPSTHWNEE